jgi:hypothetical protein
MAAATTPFPSENMSSAGSSIFLWRSLSNSPLNLCQIRIHKAKLEEPIYSSNHSDTQEQIKHRYMEVSAQRKHNNTDISQR